MAARTGATRTGECTVIAAMTIDMAANHVQRGVAASH
jgi:hypothetical protein